MGDGAPMTVSFAQELRDAAALSNSPDQRRRLLLASDAVAGWLLILAREGSREAMIGLNAAVAIGWRIMRLDDSDPEAA